VLTAVELREVVEHLVDQGVALTYWPQLLGALIAIVVIVAMVNASAASIVQVARGWIRRDVPVEPART